MEGGLSPFDFELAKMFGRTVDEMHATISNSEYIEWAGYFEYRAAMAELDK